MKKTQLFFHFLLVSMFLAASVFAQTETTLGTITSGHPDGPYIFYTSEGVKAISVAENGTVTQKLWAGTTTTTLPEGTTFEVISDANDPITGARSHFTVTKQSEMHRAAGIRPAPDSLIILSDVHAKWGPFISILKKHGVVDDNLKWAFGTNELMINGDVPDRGVDNMTCYWMIYELQRQARLAGGEVYFNFGNHDVWRILGTNQSSYVDAKYTRLSALIGPLLGQGTTYAAYFFNANTEIGRWFQAAGSGVQIIGRDLIVHAGISQAVFNLGLTVDQINTTMAANIFSGSGTLFDSSNGVTWYRGMVPGRTPETTMANLTSILQFYKVERVIIGHTEVQSSSNSERGNDPMAYTKYDRRVANENVPTDVAYTNNYGRGFLIMKHDADNKAGTTYIIYDKTKANTVLPLPTATIPGTTLDPDEDGDGVPDELDLCPGTPPGTPVDADGCPIVDSDGDGVPDSIDQCPDTPPGDKVDANGCTIVIPPIPSYANFLGNYTITYGTIYTDPVTRPYTLNVELVEGVPGESYYLKGILKNESIGNIVLKYDAAVGFTYEAQKLGVNPDNTAKDIWAAGQYQNRNTNTTAPDYGLKTLDFELSSDNVLTFSLGHWKGRNADDVSIGIYLRALDTGTTANSVVYTGGSNSAATGDNNARFYYISFSKQLDEQAVAPVVVSTTPEDNKTDVALETVVSVTFDKDITAGVLSGITISDATGVSASVEGAILTIAHDAFVNSKEYTVTIPKTAVKDLAGDIVWKFTTLAGTPPEGVSPPPTYSTAENEIWYYIQFAYNELVIQNNGADVLTTIETAVQDKDAQLWKVEGTGTTVAKGECVVISNKANPELKLRFKSASPQSGFFATTDDGSYPGDGTDAHGNPALELNYQNSWYVTLNARNTNYYIRPLLDEAGSPVGRDGTNNPNPDKCKLNFILPEDMSFVGIHTPNTPNTLKTSVSDGILKVQGLVAGESVHVYNVTGQTVAGQMATGWEQTIQLPAYGVYIVVAGNQAVKVLAGK
jgi:hypothetical protein